jgi:protein-tyrosine phosphatase
MMPEPSRLITLSGARNLRDLGGYVTDEGRRVRWRTLFRSGTLGPFDAGDRVRFAGLGIRTLCDLRTSRERAREPFALDGLIAAQDYHSWDYDTVHEWRKALGSNRTQSAARAVMFAVYEALPDRFADRFTILFRMLAQGQTPLLFNCAAGKDRTGVAAAMILLALGVPREIVIEDYALTDKVVNLERDVVRPRLEAGETMAGGFGEIAALSPELRAPLLASDPAYLDHALSSIERRHASVFAFLEKKSGIDSDTISAMRSHLLEDLDARS